MSLNNRIGRLVRQIEKLESESKVFVFRGHLEYEKALNSKTIGKKDICITIVPKQKR